jgi:hypothetical protein
LQLGSCFRHCLLPLASSLVEQHVLLQKASDGPAANPASSSSSDFAVALLKLLELAPHISRWAWVLFDRVLISY